MSPRFERRSGGPSRDGRQGGASGGRSSGGRPPSSGGRPPSSGYSNRDFRINSLFILIEVQLAGINFQHSPTAHELKLVHLQSKSGAGRLKCCCSAVPQRRLDGLEQQTLCGDVTCVLNLAAAAFC